MCRILASPALAMKPKGCKETGDPGESTGHPELRNRAQPPAPAQRRGGQRGSIHPDLGVLCCCDLLQAAFEHGLLFN